MQAPNALQITQNPLQMKHPQSGSMLVNHTRHDTSQKTHLTNHAMHYKISHNAPFCNRNVHISVTKWCMWGMGSVYCGICARGLLEAVSHTVGSYLTDSPTATRLGLFNSLVALWLAVIMGLWMGAKKRTIYRSHYYLWIDWNDLIQWLANHLQTSPEFSFWLAAVGGLCFREFGTEIMAFM